jgi:hypothetical protein
VAACSLVSATAAADAPPKADPDAQGHRISGSLSPSLLFFELGGDGHLQEKMAIGLSSRLAYSYRLVRGFELGADVSYWFLPRSDRLAYGVLLPALALRPYLPLGADDRVELGIDVHAGAVIIGAMPGIGTWTGWGVSGGPDVRAWLWPNWALELGVEISIGSGHNSGADHSWYQNKSGGFGALGPWATVVARF